MNLLLLIFYFFSCKFLFQQDKMPTIFTTSTKSHSPTIDSTTINKNGPLASCDNCQKGVWF